MKKGADAISGCGFVAKHAAVFKDVAGKLNTVVSSRDLNRASPMLLEENYAAKGFHIKAKSCDYGPMAGFVCVEPIFSKKGPGGVDSQKKENDASLKHGCKAVQICISDARLKWLADQKIITIDAKESNDKRKCIVAEKTWDGGPALSFVAERNDKDKVWALFFVPPADKDAQKADWKTRTELALKNPLNGLANAQVAESGPQPKDHHAAVAGDYDLFALWPHAASGAWTDRPVVIPPTLLGKAATTLPGQRFLAGALISELVKLTDLKIATRFLTDGVEKDATKQKAFLAKDGKKLDKDKLQEFVDAADLPKATAFNKAGMGAVLSNEQEHMGNVTLLLTKVKNELNKGIAAAGYKGGNAVHHSDDAGNPFSAEPTYPLLFFVPGREPESVENKAELKSYSEALKGEGFLVKMNPKWVL